MTEELACRIIAHHMGYRDAFNPADGDYTKSKVYKYRDCTRSAVLLTSFGMILGLSYSLFGDTGYTSTLAKIRDNK